MASTSQPVRRLPILEWAAGYQKDWLRLDVVAGLTAAAVVIPKAMAYATIAGLPVQVGLYTALFPLIIYALLGTSRPLSVSTTTTIAILVAAELATVAPNGDPAALATATATLALLVGAILVAASVLRLGFVADFISEPVLIGFKAGIGLVIVLDQIPKLLGAHIDKGSFFHNILETVNGKVDFAPPVPDLSDQGFPIVGGRLDSIDGKTAAAIVYKRRLHTVNVFVWRASGDGIQSRVEYGFALKQWSADGLRFAAISDIPSAELGQFENLYRQRSGSAGR